MKEVLIKYIEKDRAENILTDLEKNLFSKASDACNKAYAPYSNFNVGSSLLLENDIFVSGSNQENASFPCGICAERTALFSAKSNYPKLKILKIAITTKSKEFKNIEPVAPCGLCRQVLLEYEIKQKSTIEIYLFNTKKFLKISSAKDLLPFYFSEERLMRK